MCLFFSFFLEYMTLARRTKQNCHGRKSLTAWDRDGACICVTSFTFTLFVTFSYPSYFLNRTPEVCRHRWYFLKSKFVKKAFTGKPPVDTLVTHIREGLQKPATAKE